MEVSALIHLLLQPLKLVFSNPLGFELHFKVVAWSGQNKGLARRNAQFTVGPQG